MRQTRTIWAAVASILVPLLCPLESTAQASADDVRIWGSAGDEFVFLSRDAGGNFYLVGSTDGLDPSGSTRALIVKYDTERELAWSRAWSWRS